MHSLLKVEYVFLIHFCFFNIRIGIYFSIICHNSLNVYYSLCALFSIHLQYHADFTSSCHFVDAELHIVSHIARNLPLGVYVQGTANIDLICSLLILQGASTSSSQSTPSTVRPIWTAPVPAAPHQPPCSASEDSASAQTVLTGNRTASRAAPQSLRAAPSPTTSQRSPSRSCHTFTWAVPKTPPTWMCSANTTSSTSSM